jgi:ABC-2 type transport system ATP-binding protein
MTEIAIRADGLCRDFGAVRAVDHLSFEVPTGAVFGFLGPNGAGKTTTIRLLLGLMEPTAGNAQVLGHDVRTEAALIRERTGTLLEHAGLYERLTAIDNLDFYARAWRMSKEARAARIQELLEHFGLWERRLDRVEGWSRGMKQRLAVARALLHNPELVFLDEPTAGLDPAATAEFRRDIAALASQSGVTIFLTTHNLVEAEKLCGLVGILHDGRLVEIGTPAELRDRIDRSRVVIAGHGAGAYLSGLGEKHPELLDVSIDGDRFLLHLGAEAGVGSLVSAVVQAGGVVDEIRRDAPSLEDAYLQIVAKPG